MPSAGTAAAMAEWLGANQQSDGRIRDPLHGECGTYAAGLAALTFGLMAARTGEPEWAAACERSLQVAGRRPLQSEFDQLALLLLATRPAGSVVSGQWSVVPQVYHGRRLVSNNWVAMRALNYSLRRGITGSEDDAREAKLLWQRVLAWQTEDGLFVDSPGGEATPVTYHAKFCAMLALALTETDCGTMEMAEALRRGLDRLCQLVSQSGVLVPYGRSRNTLFGYAASILALRRGAGILGERRYGAVAALLEARLTRFQCPDGHIPCVLNDGEAEKRDWDVYVNNPDYNAYAAAMLLLSESDYGLRTTDYGLQTADPGDNFGRVSDQRSAVSDPSGVSSQWSVVSGPIVTIRRGDLFAAFVMSGQSVPVGTPFFCDHRYYGMQPLWIERGGVPLLEPAPYTWRGGEDRSALVNPAANPWVPYLAVGDAHYCVRRYDCVEVNESGGTVEVTAEGVPETYDTVPRWERGARALLGRATGRPHPVFRARAIDSVRLRRHLVIDTSTGAFRASTDVEGSLSAGASLHQASHAWSPDARP